jgi:hypothetical protein
VLRLKIHEDVHIAARPEVIAEHGAKERKPTDVVGRTTTE